MNMKNERCRKCGRERTDMDMKKEDMKQVEKVLDTEQVGYAFLYPSGS